MQDGWEKLTTLSRSVALTDEEKARGREQLREYMAMRPVRNTAPARHGRGPAFAGLLSMLNHGKTMGVIVTVLALTLVGGGVSYAAEGSVPGDVLYPVKVKVNENVAAAFAVSDESKAKLEARLAERRLEEAEVLAASGRLDEETGTDLEERFRAHAERSQERVNRIAEKHGPELSATLSSHFESSLKAHERVLAQLSTDPKADGNAEALATVVGDEADHTEADRRSAEDDLDAKVNEPDKRRAAENRLVEAQKKISETESYLTKREGKFAPQAVEDARAVLAQADDLVQEGLALVGASDFGGAFRKFQDAHLLASRAKVMLVMGERLGITVPQGDDRASDHSDDRRSDEGDREYRRDDRSIEEDDGEDIDEIEDELEDEDEIEDEGDDGHRSSWLQGDEDREIEFERVRKRH